MMALNGSVYRTITRSRPNIYKPLTLPKKGKNQHKVNSVFGRKAYYYNDTLTSAYIILQDKALEQRKETFFITITLNDEINLKLREQDKDISEETMIRTVSRWLYPYDFITDAIVVIEECSDSSVDHTDGSYPRLHLHIITILNNMQRKVAQLNLLRNKRMQLKIQNYWLDKRLYTEQDNWDEEEMGTIPANEIDPTAEYWLNTYVKEKMDKATGEVIKIVYRKLPVCLRGVDYMSKSLQKPIGRGKNYTLIGLKGYRKRREELSRIATTMLSE
jgi:hypothetical protein